jgi:hypothetical protein
MNHVRGNEELQSEQNAASEALTKLVEQPFRAILLQCACHSDEEGIECHHGDDEDADHLQSYHDPARNRLYNLGPHRCERPTTQDKPADVELNRLLLGWQNLFRKTGSPGSIAKSSKRPCGGWPDPPLVIPHAGDPP